MVPVKLLNLIVSRNVKNLNFSKKQNNQTKFIFSTSKFDQKQIKHKQIENLK